MNCILDALKAGDQFPHSMLVAHYEECSEFWDWWWEQRSMEALERPYTISDDDPILTTTDQNLFVDTATNAILFDQFLLNELKLQHLPIGQQITRAAYRDKLIELLAARTVLLTRRVIIFSGGGYGAGKTSSLAFLSLHRQMPVGVAAMVGTDYFKFFLPEYSLIKRVSDGRASETVQSEAKALSDRLFDRLIDRGHSFIWDSSMSNYKETLAKIQKAIAKDYDLEMIAVASDLNDAIFRAMHRAQETRRFSHPRFLEQSHRDFAANFSNYIPFFSKVSLFYNPHGKNTPDEEPLLIAEKGGINNELAVSDIDALNRFIALGSP